MISGEIWERRYVCGSGLVIPEHRLVSYQWDNTVRWVTWPVRSNAVVVSSLQQWQLWVSQAEQVRAGAPELVQQSFKIAPPAQAGHYQVCDLVKAVYEQRQLTANHPHLQGVLLFGPRVKFEAAVVKGRRRLC